MQYKSNVEGLTTVWDVRKVFKKLGITKAQSEVVFKEKDTHIVYFSVTLEIPNDLYTTLVSELKQLGVINIQAIELPEYCKHFLLKFESPLYVKY